MNVRYLGFKDQLDIPASKAVDPNLTAYIEQLSYMDGTISAIEDYFDGTNPRLRNLFPKMVFNPLPIVTPTPVLKEDQYLLAFKSFSLSQKMNTLSNFSQNLLETWKLDSGAFIEPWSEAKYWLFPQDLADVLISLMQNIGTVYKDSPDDSDMVLKVLLGSRTSLQASYKQLLVVRSKLSLDTSGSFKYWLNLQDYSFEAYLLAIEYLIDYFNYCAVKKTIPTPNAMLETGF
jgi:hypothetical protein